MHIGKRLLEHINNCQKCQARLEMTISHDIKVLTAIRLSNDGKIKHDDGSIHTIIN